ncbi:hypothetical protein [Absidia glauca]|uniref:Uncharacterized protein n=1 Tax=Absidia glauca TaxID=4829 RepID=A0A168PUW9_ABSGL|nr:hypothetical protein [Absidia glauca]
MHKKKIPEWSIRTRATSPRSLYSVWAKQYDDLHFELTKSVGSSNSCNAALWADIFDDFERRKFAVDTFREEAISTLTTTAHLAAIGIPQGGDGDFDLPLDPLPEEPSPLTDTSPPPRLSVQLQAPGPDRLVVDDINISEKFHEIQQHIHDFNNNRLHESMVPFFGNKLYARVREHNLSSWNSAIEFPGEVMLKAIDITHYFLSPPSIPSHGPHNTEIPEATLITRYIVPLLQPLFDNDNLNIKLDFTATDLSEKYKRPSSFSGCPVCSITVFPHQTDKDINNDYNEIKGSSMTDNHRLENWDLIRLGFFAKQSIDSNNLDGNVCIHIVAPFLVFYLVKLQSDGMCRSRLYTMTELLRLQLPMSISELPAYLTNLSGLKSVIHMSETFCYPTETNDDISSRRRESLQTADISFLLEKHIDRKRRNPTGHLLK